MSGGVVYAADTIGSSDIIDESILSQDIKNGEVKSGDIRDNNVGTAEIASNAVKTGEIADGQVLSADIGNGEVTSAEVLDDTLTGTDIQDTTRSVNLPLNSFVNRTDAATLNFIPSNGNSPDFVFATGFSAGDFVLEWDDDTDAGGSDVADTDTVSSTFTIPPDYVADAPVSFALNVMKDAHSGVDERLSCSARHDGGGIGLADPITTSANRITYVIGLSGNLMDPGETVQLDCGVDDGTGGSTANDLVRLRSVEFRYTATQ